MNDLSHPYLRSYRPGDLSALYALDRLCFDPPFRFSRPTMRHFAELPQAIVRLACVPADGASAEDLLGFVIVHLEEGAHGLAGYVVTLDVAVAYRGQGIAQQLMYAVEIAATEAGVGEMFLHVFHENYAAIRLYERLGYTLATTEADFYGNALHALVYRKSLAQ